jgi:guanine deaminase
VTTDSQPISPTLLPAIKAGPRGYRGFLIDAPESGNLRACRDGALLVQDGIILDSGEFSRLQHLTEAQGVKWQHGTGCLLLPGLVDGWAFLPGYPATGQISAWRQHTTNWREDGLAPVEKNFRRATARTLTPFVLSEMARHGTTTALLGVGGTLDSASEAVECLSASPLRVLPILQVRSPAEHRLLSPGGPPADALSAATAFLNRWSKKKQDQLWPAAAGLHLSPLALEHANLLHRALDLVQTHSAWLLLDLSSLRTDEPGEMLELLPAESRPAWVTEIAHCADNSRILLLLPPSMPESWSASLHAAGLRSIQSAEANRVLARRPLASSDQPKTLHASAVPTGPNLGLWHTLRAAGEDFAPAPTLAELLHQATAGAARCLGASTEFGSFEPGLSADFSVWDVASLLPLPRPRNPAADFSAEELFSLWLNRAHPTANLATYIRGQNVWLAPPDPLL